MFIVNFSVLENTFNVVLLKELKNNQVDREHDRLNKCDPQLADDLGNNG